MFTELTDEEGLMLGKLFFLAPNPNMSTMSWGAVTSKVLDWEKGLQPWDPLFLMPVDGVWAYQASHLLCSLPIGGTREDCGTREPSWLGQ